jgi:hypothetical protein
MEGAFPQEGTDHINHDGTDNRWSNLRRATTKENNRNLSIDKRNTSGVTGVHFDKKIGKYMARITSGGERIFLGLFDTIEEAAAERKKAELEHEYHINHGTRKIVNYRGLSQ